ncbi:MAG: hypothetical protein MJ217_02110 [Bacilli bacterium]|nr:hypothetical protein [Bacilli bacterium]
MTPLIITIVITVLGIIATTIVAGKTAKTEKAKNFWLLFLALGTVLVHYSSLAYHGIGHLIVPEKITTALDFLKGNPNLILPIYPCNVVMWFCIIIGGFKNKESKVFKFLVDFTFCFGIISGLVGLMANGDYFNIDNLDKYDVCKSAVAHGVMIINVLSLAVFGYFKVDTLKNMLNNLIGVVFLALDGLFCDLVALVIGGESTMNSYNAMFLWKSPIEGLSFLKFYIVAPIFIVVLFLILHIFELIKYKKKKIVDIAKYI